jgi:hypothetical protein
LRGEVNTPEIAVGRRVPRPDQATYDAERSAPAKELAADVR